MTFQEWIDEYGPKTSEEAYGQCKRYVLQMAKEFTNDLIIRAGFYYDVIWGQRQHWWLEDKDGNIVDPTAIQFPGGEGTNPVLYKFVPEDKRPIGKCANCGELIYERTISDMICSEKCEKEYLAFCCGR